MIETIDDMNHLNEILAQHDEVLVDFMLEGCGHCRDFAPVFEEYANEHNDELEFVKINIVDNQDIAHEYNVHAVPALFFVKEGEVVDNRLGSLSKEKLHSWIESVKAKMI